MEEINEERVAQEQRADQAEQRIAEEKRRADELAAEVARLREQLRGPHD